MNQNPSFHGWDKDYGGSHHATVAMSRQGEKRHPVELTLTAALVFFAPINILRTDLVYFTLSDAMTLGAALTMVCNRSLSFSSMGAGTFFWNIGLALLTGMLLASSLLYGDIARGLILGSQYLFAYLLLSHVLLSRSASDTIVLLKVFVASVAVMCIHGIYVIHVVGETFTVFVSGSGRLQGFVERENECAALIALTVPIVLWLAASGAMRLGWVLMILPLFAYTIMLTGSNTGLFGLCYAVAMSVLLSGSWRQIFVAGGVTAALYAGLLTWGTAILPSVFQRRVLGALESGSIEQAGTFTGRLDLVHEALSRTSDAMLFGVGADQYRETSLLSAPVHNMYLLVWIEAGFLGIVGILLMLLGALLPAIVAYSRPGQRLAAVCTLTSVTLFALLINAMPHVYGRFFTVALLLGVAPSLMTADVSGSLAAASPRWRRPIEKYTAQRG